MKPMLTRKIKDLYARPTTHMLSLILALSVTSACGDADSSEQKKNSQDARAEEKTEKSRPTKNSSTPDLSSIEDEALSSQDSSKKAPANQDAAENPPQAKEPEPCRAPDGVSNNPRSMEEAIALINALPKPVTVRCYIEALQRPLHLNATASRLSVQPAVSAESPRMFLFQGPLITSIVPEGVDSNLVEFSFLLSNRTSLKGEIAFPITKDLSSDAAYLGVLKSDGTSTRCAPCHGGEAPAEDAMSDKAFYSRALKPISRNDVPISWLQEASVACGESDDGNCALLKAIFGHGVVLPQSFPQEMPTMF